MIKHFYKVHPDYGMGIAKRIGLPVEKAKL